MATWLLPFSLMPPSLPSFVLSFHSFFLSAFPYSFILLVLFVPLYPILSSLLSSSIIPSFLSSHIPTSFPPYPPFLPCQPCQGDIGRGERYGYRLPSASPSKTTEPAPLWSLPKEETAAHSHYVRTVRRYQETTKSDEPWDKQGLKAPPTRPRQECQAAWDGADGD